MKSVFLNGNRDMIRTVYRESRIAVLKERAGLIDGVFTKADVLSGAADFSDVEYAFSTWGMPAFSEEEIARVFPYSIYW